MRGIVGNRIIEEEQRKEQKKERKKERKQERKQRKSPSVSLSSAPDEDDAEQIDASSDKKPKPPSKSKLDKPLSQIQEADEVDE